jgi:mono/diheme cytochrome c family protein
MRETRMRRMLTVAVGLLALSACKHEIEPPDREARLADAETRFQEQEFDTLSWESDDARALEGNAVYAAKCRNCHGTLGVGGTEYATSRGLDVPSLVQPDWSMEASIDSVRHRVFVGHASGMPTWGIAGISLREIDAVSFYVLDRLRPEVLGGS